MSDQRILSELARDNCASCGRAICQHPDPALHRPDSAGAGIPLSACPGAFPVSIHNGGYDAAQQ